VEFIIKKDDAQKILDYLIQKPFVEVHGLVKILTTLKDVVEPKIEQEKVSS
jgi:hypothetical protein